MTKINKKFMKLLQKRMRRACNVTDDSLQVTYYMRGSVITIVVIHPQQGLTGLRTFDSLEAFIWALILDDKGAVTA